MLILIIIGNLSIASDRRWQISIEQNDLSSIREYDTAPWKYTINRQNQILSLGYLIDIIKAKQINYPLNYPHISLTPIIRMGRSNMGFDWDYILEHEKYNIDNNTFWGGGAIMILKWDENENQKTKLGLEMKIKLLYDHGKIENRNIQWQSTRSGYVYAQKVRGSWYSIQLDSENTIKLNNFTYMLGVFVPINNYNITYYDYPGRPANYESDSSSSRYEVYIYAGMGIKMFEAFNLSFRIDSEVRRYSNVGYSVKMDYEF